MVRMVTLKRARGESELLRMCREVTLRARSHDPSSRARYRLIQSVLPAAGWRLMLGGLGLVSVLCHWQRGGQSSPPTLSGTVEWHLRLFVIYCAQCQRDWWDMDRNLDEIASFNNNNSLLGRPFLLFVRHEKWKHSHKVFCFGRLQFLSVNDACSFSHHCKLDGRHGSPIGAM